MNRPSRVFALLAIATSIAACSVGAEDLPNPTVAPSPSPSLTPAPTATPSPTPSPVETPTHAEPTADPATVLAANGTGPYVVGASLADLQSRGLVADVEGSFHCDDSWQSGAATGRYAGRLSATFYLGRLIDVHTNSAELVTPSGARVGTTLAELQAIYGSHGTLITGTSGNQALSVRVPDTDLGIVFYFDATNTTAVAMSAGKVERLEMMAVVGEGC